MKQRITALIVLCCLLLSLCCGCDNGEDTSESSTPQISQNDDDSTPESKPTLTEGRTMFIYMCGSNLETKQGLASKNINEILANNFNGSYMKISYMDMMKPQKVEKRTAEQIIDDIRSGLQRLQ